MQWLIDGHNLIGHMPTLRLDDPDDEAKLVEYLRRYSARTGHRLAVIFDPGPVYRPGETQTRGRVTVQFASPGQTADQLIRQRLGRLKNPPEVIVVSSDRAVQQAARQARARTLDSAEFARQLLQTLAAGSTETDRGSQAEVTLSAAEVDEWLKLFNRRKPDEPSGKRNVTNRKSRRSPGLGRNDSTPPTPGRPRNRTGSDQT